MSYRETYGEFKGSKLARRILQEIILHEVPWKAWAESQAKKGFKMSLAHGANQVCWMKSAAVRARGRRLAGEYPVGAEDRVKCYMHATYISNCPLYSFRGAEKVFRLCKLPLICPWFFARDPVMPMIEKLKEFKTDDNRIVVCCRKVKVTGSFRAEFARSLCYDPHKLSPHKLLKAEVTVEMTIPHLVKDSSGQVSKRLNYLSFHLIPKEIDAETLVKEICLS